MVKKNRALTSHAGTSSRKSYKLFTNIYTVLMFVFLYMPILVLIVFSFNDSKSTAKWAGFTLKWYSELFSNSMIMNSLYYTLLVATITAVVSTILGVFASFGIHYMKKWQQNMVLNINSLPMLNPDIVTGVSLMIVFVFVGMRLGLLTMIIAHITFATPYVVLSILPKFKQMPEEIMEAAMDLGATPFQAFRKVVLPEIKPGIVTGALIAFTLSIDDFVISFFTTGNGVQNLSITIYSFAKKGIKPEINALSAIMFVTILLLLIVINKRTDIEEL